MRAFEQNCYQIWSSATHYNVIDISFNCDKTKKVSTQRYCKSAPQGILAARVHER